MLQAFVPLGLMLISVFMLIERMIKLLQENSTPGILCILIERKPLPVMNPISAIVLYVEAVAHAQMVTVCRTLKPCLLLTFWKL